MRRVRARGIAAHVRAGAAAFTCQVEEVSDEGAFLRTDRRLGLGLSIEVDLVKPGGRKALHTRARTSRVVESGASAQPGIEVQFVSINPDDQQRLAAWIDELSGLSAAVAPAEEAPSQDATRMMVQVKGLLLEMDALRDQLRERDGEVEDLRRQLATVEQLLGRRKGG
ncbi:MAG: hypothetical protein E6J78_07520 [Deltaproteobacteria bacterium]|nr:MAG: hypothetical protein E6J78_07520 [Deltaproteobacteria bacterium]